MVKVEISVPMKYVHYALLCIASTEVRSSYDKCTPMTEDLECQLKVRDMWNLIWFNGIDIHVWLPVPSGDSAK